ncbi:MAG: hypothetical protein Q3X95_04805 [Duodenibacillus sp.]|nr:hypothetical protein [Duodenibacillus sp.]
MTLAVFDIEYEGLRRRETTSGNPAVRESVIGLDAMLTNAGRALFGYLVEPEVDVRATDEVGCLEVDLGFNANYGMARRASLAGVPQYIDPQPAVVMEALGLRAPDLADASEAERPEGWVSGLIPLLIRLNGRHIDRVFLTGDLVDVEVGDEVFHIPVNTYRLLRHIGVRRGLQQLVSAIADPDISRIIFCERETRAPILELGAGDITSLALVEDAEVPLVDEVRTMALALAAPVFRNDDCWSFTDGLQTIHAHMCDEEFLHTIDSGVFGLRPGEILIVNMHVTTVQRADEGLVSIYDIVRVIDHRKPGKHILIPGI